MQPLYQGVVNKMVGQLVRLLWAEERRGNGRYRCRRTAPQPAWKHALPPPLLLPTLPAVRRCFP